ncbi:sas10/U3 ribonucleoprotein (Utp) family protein isoform X2 [Carex rostrata]
MGRGGSKRRHSSSAINSQSQSQFKSKSKRTDDDTLWEDDDDDIDAFHKQRDVIPLDVTQGESDDEDMEQPVFDLQEDDSEESQDEDNDSDDADKDDTPLRGFAAKIARQAKYLKQKFGGGEDEMDEDEDKKDEEETNKKSWGGRKNIYYNADNADFEIQSSDEELPQEEEAEVLRIQREKAKSLSMADLGLRDSDEDESDSDKQNQDGLQDDKSKGKRRRTLDASYEEIKKDIGALSKEEQMDVVFSSAPELFGLLSELNEAVDQLKDVKAVDAKVDPGVDTGKAGMKQLEAKEALLLMYCQAISFYLLLKSEGLAVRDHPVIGRLVEIKNMLKKFKEIEERLPSPTEQTADPAKKADSYKMAGAQVTQEQEKHFKMVSRDEVLVLEDIINNQKPVKETTQQNAKQKDQDDKIGLQSLEMLKIRANLEAKLREKGLYNCGAKTKLKNSLSTKPTDGSNVIRDDFDDEVQNDKSSSKSKLSHMVLNKGKKVKLASGDDDLPKRDDIGERRRKHELRVLGRIGADNDNDEDGDHDNNINNDDEEHDDVSDDDVPDDDASEDEFYKEAKRKHTEKLITRQQLNAAKQIVPSMDEEEQQADGKRQISYQMNKNRGLTRHRKKDLKNPRKKYRAKHKKWEQRRKGQVRDIKRPSGSYGGEASGINPSVSHSVRF